MEFVGDEDGTMDVEPVEILAHHHLGELTVLREAECEVGVREGRRRGARGGTTAGDHRWEDAGEAFEWAGGPLRDHFGVRWKRGVVL